MGQGHYDRILSAATLAGMLTLKNGGEIYRVEEVMESISRAFGASRCESYATPTTIMLTVYDEGEKAYTVMRRVHNRDTNLGKVEEVNRVSRDVREGSLGLDETLRVLREIEAHPRIGLLPTVLASALVCATFTYLFGGTARDFACGLFTGAALRLIVTGISKWNLGYFFVNLTGGAVSALMGWLCFALGLAADWNVLTIATLMQLVPGLLFTNAFRDIVAGDLVSGISRAFETLAIAVALACGAALTLAAVQFSTGVSL